MPPTAKSNCFINSGACTGSLIPPCSALFSNPATARDRIDCALSPGVPLHTCAYWSLFACILLPHFGHGTLSHSATLHGHSACSMFPFLFSTDIGLESLTTHIPGPD